MTKTEKLLLAVTAAFFVLSLFLLPRGGVVREVEPAFTMPGPTPLAGRPGDELVVTLETKIDLNRATAEELTALPGVGPVLAGAIVAYRDEHGPFSSVDELLLVSGFGSGTLSALRAAMGETPPEDVP